MANVLPVSDLAAETLEATFMGETKLTKTVDTHYAKEFENADFAPGSTIRVVLPVRSRGTMTEGNILDAQSTEKEVVSVTVNQWNDGRYISSAEMKLEEREFIRKVTKPDASSIARFVERKGFQAIHDQMSLAGGTPGTTAASFDLWADMTAQAQQMLIPSESGIYAAIDPKTNARFSSNERKLFNPREEISGIWRKGEVQEAAGVGDFYTSTNLFKHTNGDGSTTGAQVDVALTNSTTLPVKSVAAGTVYTKGSQFMIAGVNVVDPETKVDTGNPMWFTLTEDAAIAANEADLVFQPPLVTSGSLQNVTNAPAGDALVTFMGAPSKTYVNNVHYHKDAIILVGLPLPTDHIDGAGAKATLKRFKNVPIRTMTFYRGEIDQLYLRYDVLFGWAVKRWQWVTRVWDREVA